MFRVLFLILVVMSSLAFAQNEEKPEPNESPQPTVEKVEFGKVPNGQIRNLLDQFLVELENIPNGQGYIINHGTKKEIAKREKLLRKYIAYRRFDASRFTFLRSYVQSEIKTQLRTVPPGAKPPKLEK